MTNGLKRCPLISVSGRGHGSEADVRLLLASPLSVDEQLKTTNVESDGLSEVSLDFAQVEIPGSWRYRSVPLRTVARRSRAPLPPAFLDSQHYASDSEQVLHSSISRQPHFGSIPTISR